ncbi:MAG TPA: YhjD/YihY/BrkB family envelope integrity protein [Candidatus Sulfotelmatobacter sp.]|nr:YhjD/YihY/BrkB family envelope integrity protein [Candidatus Sulfotelmatobacter sp.]
MLSALAVMIVGPQFGGWLAGRISSVLLVRSSVAVHPLVRGGRLYGARGEGSVFPRSQCAAEIPATLPGAVVAVGCWIGLSYLLGVYFRHFAHFNKTYGTLGAAIALMTWLYWRASPCC